MSAPVLAEAWATGRNNFHLIRLIAAWLVIYGHAWAITGSQGQDDHGYAGIPCAGYIIDLTAIRYRNVVDGPAAFINR